MILRLALALTGVASLAACAPPATADYVERVELTQGGDFASQPLPSPDSEGAMWSNAPGTLRLIYGQPGTTPSFALTCIADGTDGMDQTGPSVRFTRYARADPGAGALIAIVGNRRAARLPIDATDLVGQGRGWSWQGSVPATTASLIVFQGTGEVTATVPGAGKLVLNPSPLPAAFIAACRDSGRARPLRQG